MPSAWQLGASWLRAPANEVSFAVRALFGRVARQRRQVDLPHEAKSHLFAHLPAVARAGAERTARKLVADFDLVALERQSTARVFAANLAHLAGLLCLTSGRALPAGDDGIVRALDAGCGDFHYASALQRWLSRQGAPAPRQVVLRGIELDGDVAYPRGECRRDHARANAALAAAPGSTVTFENADFCRRLFPPQDVVSCFFPFVTFHACLRWGAPVSRCRPRRFLTRAVATVRRGGWLLLVNQTDTELAKARRLLADLPVACLTERSWATTWVPWAPRTVEQVATLWQRL